MLTQEQVSIAAIDYGERKPEGHPQGWAALDFLCGANWALKEAKVAELNAKNAHLLQALKRLSLMAQTTGGTAGKDPELIAAINEAAAIIAEYEQNNA